MTETEYKLAYEGPQIDAAIGRALPGGAIDLSLSNKVNDVTAVISDAAELTKCGYFRYVPQAQGVPNNYGVLDALKFDDNFAAYVSATASDDLWFATKTNGVWHAPKQLATTTPPVKCEAGLMNGFMNPVGGAGGVHYCKTQDGIVFVMVQVQSDAAVSNVQFSTMPSDCCPERTVYTVCLCNWSSDQIAHMAIDAGGPMIIAAQNKSGTFSGIFAYRAKS